MNEDTANAIRKLLTVGATPITPPIMGALVGYGLLTPNGIDQEKARALLTEYERAIKAVSS